MRTRIYHNPTKDYKGPYSFEISEVFFYFRELDLTDYAEELKAGKIVKGSSFFSVGRIEGLAFQDKRYPKPISSANIGIRIVRNKK